MRDTPFTDIKTLRQRARSHIEQGRSPPAIRPTARPSSALNEALATEIVRVLRHRWHDLMAAGINARSVAAIFLQHANEEQGHVDQIAQRIMQLGGEPSFSPEGLLTRSHAEYVEGDTLESLIKEDLVAERTAIDSYRKMVGYLGNNDPTTRRLM